MKLFDINGPDISGFFGLSDYQNYKRIIGCNNGVANTFLPMQVEVIEWLPDEENILLRVWDHPFFKTWRFAVVSLPKLKESEIDDLLRDTFSKANPNHIRCVNYELKTKDQYFPDSEKTNEEETTEKGFGKILFMEETSGKNKPDVFSLLSLPRNKAEKNIKGKKKKNARKSPEKKRKELNKMRSKLLAEVNQQLKKPLLEKGEKKPGYLKYAAKDLTKLGKYSIKGLFGSLRTEAMRKLLTGIPDGEVPGVNTGEFYIANNKSKRFSPWFILHNEDMLLGKL